MFDLPHWVLVIYSVFLLGHHFIETRLVRNVPVQFWSLEPESQVVEPIGVHEWHQPGNTLKFRQNISCAYHRGNNTGDFFPFHLMNSSFRVDQSDTSKMII